jgi:hypothetical protein
MQIMRAKNKKQRDLNICNRMRPFHFISHSLLEKHKNLPLQRKNQRKRKEADSQVVCSGWIRPGLRPAVIQSTTHKQRHRYTIENIL